MSRSSRASNPDQLALFDPSQYEPLITEASIDCAGYESKSSPVPREIVQRENFLGLEVYYTDRPLNLNGAARIAFGQYRAWQVGWHGQSDRHEALVQVAPLLVHRDGNKDGKRTGDPTDEGLFGINQHWGYNMPQVGKASAGCLVGQSRDEHREFMALIKQDRRYQSQNYAFITTIIPGDKL